MPRPMDLVGAYVNWQGAVALSGGRILLPTDAMILTGESSNELLSVHSAGGGPGPHPPGGGHLLPAPPPWAFSFLKYVSGGVTTEPYSGIVMTGSMSGCYTFRYHFNAVPYVGHVGSGPTVAITLEAKRRWKIFAATPA